MSGTYVTSPNAEYTPSGFTPMENVSKQSPLSPTYIKPSDLENRDALLPIPDPTILPSTPYISTRGKLTRVYITYSTIFLLFLLFTTLSTLSSVHSQTDDTKSYITRTCRSLESTASRTANLPRELISRSISSNVNTINTMVQKMATLTSAALDMFSDVIAFFLNAWKQLLKCLMEVVLDGSLRLLRDQAAQLTALLQKIATGITNSVNTVLEAGDRLLDALNKIDFLNIIPDGSSRLPRLEMLKVPDSLEQTIQGLSVANFNELDNKVAGLITRPFQIASDVLKNVSGKNVVTEEQFTKPPAKFIGFCDDIMDLSILDSIAYGMSVALWTCVVVIVILLVLSIAFEVVCVKRNATIFENHVEEVIKYASLHSLTISKDTVSGIYHELEKPWYNSLSRFLSSKTQPTKERQVRFRWAMDYLHHPPSWLCIAIGLFGCLVALWQLSTLNRIETRDIPDFVARLRSAETAIGEKTNVRVGESLEGYITTVNMEMETTVTRLNEQLFGPVQSLSRNTSQTITAVIEETMKFLKETLKMEIFGNLVDKIYFCLLGVKVNNVQRFLGVLAELKIDNPPPLKADMFRYEVNATDLVNTNSLLDSVVGVPTVDPNTGTVIYSGGLVAGLLKGLGERAKQSLYASIFFLLFGMLIIIQMFTAVILFSRKHET